MSTQRIDFSVEQLLSWTARHQIHLDHDQSAKLAIFLETLQLWNRRVALVSQSDPSDILCKHFADSIAVVPHCGDKDSIADLGTGAGFPGIPLAIARPFASVALIESNQRKCSFLHEVIRAAGLTNARVLCARIEALADSTVESHRYDLVTARALTDTGRLLSIARPLLRAGGRVISMKGPRFAAELRSASLTALGFTSHEIEGYTLPDGSERFLITFSKSP